MERIELEVQVREASGKGVARQLRRTGFIPGVVYGAKTDSIPLSINATKFKQSIKGEASSNAIINLLLEGSGQKEPKVVMIREMQVAPVSRDILHIDFQVIKLEEEVEVSVPVELVGKAEGTKEGGILQQVERELEIRCLPLSIPEKIEVDISSLGIGDSIHVSDISAGEGFEILSAGEKTIATVASPLAEEEEVAEEEVEVEGEEAAAEEEGDKQPVEAESE
jgi:large subunit ribosomal protein L25